MGLPGPGHCYLSWAGVGHSTQLTLSFGPLLLVLSAPVGHTHLLWAGDGSCSAQGFTLMGLHLPLL